MSKAFAEEVLRTLRKNGADITKPHRFEFYVYVPKESNAMKAANKIRRSGFSAGVSRSAREGWLVAATKTLTPATSNLADQGRFFEQIAAAVNGQFDGWETEVMPSGTP